MANEIVHLTEDNAVVEQGGVLVIDSRLVADELGVNHSNTLMRTVDKYLAEIQELGVVVFQTQKPTENSNGGRPERYCLLNEAQANFVMTLSRNTDRVVRCKLFLTKAFEKAKQLLKSPVPESRPKDPHPDLIAAAGRAILGGVVAEHLIQGAIAEATRKHYPELAPSIDEFKKLLPMKTEAVCSVTVTDLAQLYADRTGISLSAVAMNKLLAAKGLQRETGKKEPRWEPMGAGNEFAEMVLQTAKGRDRTCYQLRWFPSVVDQLV